MKNPNINTKGTKNPNVKLTPEQVAEIRMLYQTGDYTLRKLAEQYKVCHTHIRRIAYEISWNTL